MYSNIFPLFMSPKTLIILNRKIKNLFNMRIGTGRGGMVIGSNQRLSFTGFWVLIVILSYPNGVAESQVVRGIFVFGDSLVDVGNNNYLSSIAKSNYYPYGVDFEYGPTGRFSNGKTFVDFIGKLLFNYHKYLACVHVKICIVCQNELIPFFLPFITSRSK